MRNTIKRFLEPAIKLKTTTLKAIFIGFLIGVYKLFSVILVQYIINNISLYNYNNILYSGVVLLIMIIAVFIVFQYIYHWRWGSQIYQYSKYINEKHLSKIILIDNTEYEKIGTGRIISSLSSGVELWSDSLTSISYFLPNFFITLFYGAYLSYKGGIIVLIIFILMMIILSFCVFVLNNKGLIYRSELANNKIYISKSIVRLLMSKFEIINSDKLKIELDKVSEQYDDAILANKRLSYYTFFIHESIRIFINIFIICVCIYLGYYGYNSGIQISIIVGLIMTMGYIDYSAQNLAVIYKQTTKSLSSIQKLRELGENKKISGYNTGSTFSYKSGNIHIDDISFSYSDNNKLFDNFSINILGSQKTALVGPSGGGKSTLIKLIAGYIRPDTGDIYIDDQNLLSVSLKSYYKHVGYLTQEPSVFDGTIRENLMYGISEDNTDNTDNNQNKQTQTNKTIDIDNIIKLSKCEWIYNLKDGLDTEIGEKGIRLSGGQRQRLAIAKIMLKNPDIILLDEPTSALDSENEELITQALNNLFENKTVIIIAHRLQTVKNSNDIIYINNGNIIERGTHEELLSKGGDYAKMVELQSGF